MRIVALTDNKALKAPIAALAKAKGLFESVELRDSDSLKASLKEFSEDALLYLDIKGMESKDLKAALKSLAKGEILWGLIDLKGQIEDVAELFWLGASDYVGKEVGTGGFLPARLKRVLESKGQGESEPSEGAAKAKSGAQSKGDAPAKNGAASAKGATAKPAKNANGKTPSPGFVSSAIGWNNIKEGREYSFSLLYTQIDSAPQLFDKIGESRFATLKKEYKKAFESMIAHRQGLVWMWKEAAGVALIPYNGKECPIIADVVRFFMDMTILSAEVPGLKEDFSFSMALHIGETVYMEPGRTGTLVSDSINSIFHLGQKFTQKGDFVLTEEAAGLIPGEVEDLFVPAGNYEGRSITRMRRLEY